MPLLISYVKSLLRISRDPAVSKNPLLLRIRVIPWSVAAIAMIGRVLATLGHVP